MSELVIKKKQGIFTFQSDDIVYMEKCRRKIRLHVRCRGCGCKGRCSACKGDCCGCDTEFYGSFSEVEPYLDERFMRCHRSYIINMDAIVWMSDCEIYMDTNESIHMGRDSYGRAKKIFACYLKEKYPQKTLKNPNLFL